MLAFFTRSGALQGVASHRGGLLVFISEFKFPTYRRLTFAYDQTAADVFDEVLATLAGGQEMTHKGLRLRSSAGADDQLGHDSAAVSAAADTLLVSGSPDPESCRCGVGCD